MVGLQRIIEKQNKVVITDRMWARLLSSTNQPSFLSAKDVIEDKKEEELSAQMLDEDNYSDDNLENKEVSYTFWVSTCNHFCVVTVIAVPYS